MRNQFVSAPTALRIFALIIALISSIVHADSRGDSLAKLRPVQDIHDELQSRFTPIDQPDGDVGINHSGDGPFTGDCDDYYTAAFNQLYQHGYAPYAQLMAVRATGKPHIVACVDVDGRPVCLDHNRKRTSNIRNLKSMYRLTEKREVL